MDIKQLAQWTTERRTIFYGVCEKIITIASTLLAVTVTFRTSLLATPGSTIRCGWLIILAWAALTLTVASGLLTLLGHADAVSRVIKEMVANRPGVAAASRFYKACPWIMAASLTTALVAFVIFAALNTPK